MNDSFTRKIENLFEETLENKNPKTFLNRDQKKFEIENEIQYMENINFDPDLFFDQKSKWIHFCKQIIPYFDGGYLTFTENTKSILCGQFLLGTFEIPHKDPFFLKGPKSSVLQLLKTDASSFIKKMKLDQILNSAKYKVFFIRLDEDYSLYLLSATPEPWNQLKMEIFLKKAIHYSCDSFKS